MAGQAGLDAVDPEAFDAVIVDLFMPGPDGLAPPGNPGNPSLPIIAVSGFMFQGTARCRTHPMATEAGAVAKPARPNELVQAITDAMRREHASRSAVSVLLRGRDGDASAPRPLAERATRQRKPELGRGWGGAPRFTEQLDAEASQLQAGAGERPCA